MSSDFQALLNPLIQYELESHDRKRDENISQIRRDLSSKGLLRSGYLLSQVQVTLRRDVEDFTEAVFNALLKVIKKSKKENVVKDAENALKILRNFSERRRDFAFQIYKDYEKGEIKIEPEILFPTKSIVSKFSSELLLFLKPEVNVMNIGNFSEVDLQAMTEAIRQAEKSICETGKINPKVGAVIVKDNRIIGSAFRGELKSGEHAEFTLLEKKFRDQILAGATIYTTLEPCTSRNPPKIPCVERIISRKFSKVLIGMLDPNQKICGRGILALRHANIEVNLFPCDLMAQLEELNRDFIRYYSMEDEEAKFFFLSSKKTNSKIVFDFIGFLGMVGCVFRGNPTSDSDLIRPPIPIESDQ
jgi:pyrimidine deaminase RibD-like protein